jgi:putative ABC transport system ATP-binding protein
MTDQSGRQPVLRTDNVCRVYPDGNVNALNGVSVTICEGEYVAIMGPSGSGKSTLLNMLGGLDVPSSGEVYFQEKPLSELESLDGYRSMNIGFIFQSFHLMPTLRAVENVQVPMFGLPLSAKRLSAPERAARAAELLALVGLEQRKNHFPNQLSVGERQRVAIARALANEPALLLADEPTGNLDSKTAAGVLDLFDRLHREQNLTLVIVTHGESLAERAERVIRIEDGRVADSGSSAKSTAVSSRATT